MSLTVRRAGPEVADELLELVQRAFAQRPVLDPPADALVETRSSFAERLAGERGVVVYDEDRLIAGLVMEQVDDAVFLRRVSVATEAQGRGVFPLLVAGAERFAVELAPQASHLRVLARAELPSGVELWAAQGFATSAERAPYVELSRRLPTRIVVPDGEAMRALGGELAAELRAGDLVVLVGELGAGKTTLTQGLGAGLGVRGDVTSPTFVISRVHPSLVGGPALVHVDAYRLGDGAELDDLDLDMFVDQSVMVVEWGRGLAEKLNDNRLEVEIVRSDSDEQRVVWVRRQGPRWQLSREVAS